MGDYLIRARELIERPSESLAVEIKTWIDPGQPEGAAKIVRTVLALYNNNGGYFIIGFDDKTLQPVPQTLLSDVRSSFHPDEIQRLIGKYASEPIEIFVEFPESEGCEYPVIVVPGGVKTPVATKSELKVGDKKLISVDDVYIRTLRTNNTPSSAKATWKDWARIIEICLENREADIGRFMRRHLNGIDPKTVSNITAGLLMASTKEETNIERVTQYLDESNARFQQLLTAGQITLPPHGSWEISLLLTGEIPHHSANRDFIQLLHASNPSYDSWPVWIVNLGGNHRDQVPYLENRCWEQFIDSQFFNRIIDFMRFDPQGKFYQRSALPEDMFNSSRGITPNTVLDCILPIIRTSEAIAVGISFAKAMGANPEKTLLSFGFRWNGLRGRTLLSIDPHTHMYPRGPTRDDKVVSFVDVPMETPVSALSNYVSKVVQPLYEIFDGYIMNPSAIESWTRKTLERRQ